MTPNEKFILIHYLGFFLGLTLGFFLGRFSSKKEIQLPKISFPNIAVKKPSNKNIPRAFTEEELWKREQDKN